MGQYTILNHVGSNNLAAKIFRCDNSHTFWFRRFFFQNLRVARTVTFLGSLASSPEIIKKKVDTILEFPGHKLHGEIEPQE